MMTREQLDRLNRLLIDVATTASRIELQALADKSGKIARWAEDVRANCIACMRMANNLPKEADSE